MYEEIIRHLMKWEIVLMAFWALLFLVLPISVYVYILIRDRKKKKKRKAKKKKWNNLTETPEEKALAFVIVGVLFFCVCFGISLYSYLSLREDMINENYVTYTGEFYYDAHPRGSDYLQWTNEHGDMESIRHNHHIEKFQTTDQTLKDGYYKGTIVYSPRGDVLLWWDAEPIED
ncbi:MAG: hypothetical protein E7584_03545 [Ruminococcaceae bacterium]|nr:hypothetical protein [Oscillospiraceae bacterium]